jgi:hypothetical protein
MDYIVLKRKIKSKKFNIVFPSNVELNYFQSGNDYFVEHPEFKNLYSKVSIKNIKRGLQLKLF